MGDDVLAIDGGSPVLAKGPPGWPPEDDAIREALVAAALDGSWGRYRGPHCQRLADRIARLHDVENVMPCSSGTIAVELALRGVGVGDGAEVLLAGYDFAGNFAAILSVGARPVIVDVETTNWQFDPEKIHSAVGPNTRAMIVSHLHGAMAPMRAIVEQARRFNLHVVEDACQAPGAMVDGRVAGCWGDAGVWSFGGSKLLTAGRGGAVFTPRADVYQRIKLACLRGNHAFPLSELQALVLVPQMDQLARRNATRATAAKYLIEALSHLPGIRPLADANPTEDLAPGFFKLGMQYDAASFNNHPRDAFAAAVRAEGVALDAGFRDFSRRSDRRCRKVGDLEESRRAGQGALVLHHPVLLEDSTTLRLVAEALEKVTRAFTSATYSPPNTAERSMNP